MKVIKYLIKRLVSIIVTTSAIIAVAYLMMFYAPGSFFSASNIMASMGPLAQSNPQLVQQYMDQFKARYGLNQPLWEQILKYIWHSFTFNFGNSFQNPTMPIIEILKTAFPISAELAVGAVLLAVIIGVPLGIVAALKRNTWVDSVLTTVSLGGQALPAFVIAAFLVLLFGVVWPGTIPVNGWGKPGNFVLPIVALSLGNIGVITRFMRSSLVEALRQEYIRTAEAKGVRYWPLIFRHAFRNSLTALITVVGPSFAFTVVGTVWVENIFSIPGLGAILNTAFGADDFPLAITNIYILCIMVMGMNLVVDICYSLLDPRVELE